MPLPPGTRLGPYEVLGSLGAGGMGEVYRARDTKLGRDVALKLLPEAFARDADRSSRFEREARALAALNHPNIAQIYGLEGDGAGPRAGEPHGPGPALAMELVEGPTLDQVIAGAASRPHGTAGGGLPLGEVLSIARQLADALEAAHDAGIVHRDLKPSNIKVRDDGTVKVLDFGLAKALLGDAPGGRQQDASPSTMTSPALTQAGIILGTAAYMSPEQARGRPVDKRADIWAFGVILFEMLTGRHLFAGETMSDTIAAVLTRDPDLGALPAGVPPRVAALVARCLQRDPKRRLRDIGDARLDLEDPAVDASAPGMPRTSSMPAAAGARPIRARGRFLVWTTAALGLALAASLVWPWFGVRPAAPAASVRFDVLPPGDATMALSSRPAVAVSPDGSAVVFVASTRGISHLYLRELSDVEVREIPGTDHASDPAFSPNGKWIAFVTDDQLRKISRDGATAVSLGPVNDPRGLTWLDDRTIVYAAGVGGGLLAVPAEGGPSSPITTLDASKHERSHRWPAAVPGGKAVLFTVGTPNNPDDYNSSEIDAVIVATGERKKVLDAASFVRATDKGTLLIMRSGVLFAAGFDASRLALTSEPAAVLPGVDGDGTTGAGHFSIGSDGTLAYVPGTAASDRRRLAWADRSGVITPIDVAPGLYNDPKVSPDGTRLALVVGPSGSGDIWIYDFTRQSLSRLTFDGHEASPFWSADGRSVYSALMDPMAGQTAIQRKAADGSAQAETLATVPGRTYLGFVDRAGAWALVANVQPARADAMDMMKVSLTGPGAPVVLEGGAERAYAPAVSPDGQWMAFISTETGRTEVYVRDIAGSGRWQISTGGARGPTWSPDGRELFFRNDTRLMVATVSTSPRFQNAMPKLLFTGVYDWRTESGMSYDVDPVTGRFLLILPPAPSSSDSPSRVRIITKWN